MTKIQLTLLTLFFFTFTFGQVSDCNCINELNDISEQIKNAKSYKVQIKGNKIIEFEKWKTEIETEIKNDSLINFFCVGYLQKYISFINDLHNQVYATQKHELIQAPNYPKSIDTNQIQNDSISGIYFAGVDKILIKRETNNTWLGITLESNSSKWEKGKIRLVIKKTKNNIFEIFEYFQNGYLFYQKDVKIENGRIHSTFWNKQNKYFFNQNHINNFTYKTINSSFDYFGIKTLNRTNSLIEEMDKFFNQNLGNLTKPNLIIDLRNNGGGSTKQAEKLLESLKNNENIIHIYIIINFKTASAAELVTLKLKEDKRTIIVGENSKGMIEYGYGNKSYSSTSSCSEFKIDLSTEQTNKKLSIYECIGIKPDYSLNNESDWIEQIININPKE
ncbi:MAG: S41 family peptidase [Flavobacterium sp.]|uniref:S41 family peptidase n=1 Tax=Flavobacterium sp. TaxID=239 RepID=UPI003BBDA637